MNIDELKWKTKDGQVFKIWEMKTSHIENCIRILERRIEINKIYIVAMQSELKNRNIHSKSLTEILNSPFSPDENLHFGIESLEEEF